VWVRVRVSGAYHNIQFLIFALQQIPSLNRIRITYPAKFDHNVDTWGSLMAYIFSKGFTIQKCSFISNMSDYNMITSTWSINPSLKYLHVCDILLNNLFSLLSFTPQLYCLRAMISTSGVVLHENVVLIHLKKANLRLDNLHFSQLQMFIKLAPNLQSLRLMGYFDRNDENFLKERLWYELLKNIKYFDVNLKTFGSYDSEKTILRDYISCFNGKSWFSYEETGHTLKISIQYKSAAM
jgi:hypothetical protein